MPHHCWQFQIERDTVGLTIIASGALPSAYDVPRGEPMADQAESDLDSSVRCCLAVIDRHLQAILDASQPRGQKRRG